MDSQHPHVQDVGQIVRRAEELGHDPARVARALDYPPEDDLAARESPAEKVSPSG